MAFQIYEDEFYSGMYEVEMQNTELFNGASNGTMNIIPREHIGDFSKEAFFTEEANVVTRRDITSDADGTATELDSDELIGIKLYRRFQWDKKMTDIKRIGYTEQEYSFIVGQQTAKAKMVEMLNSGLLALVTCLGLNADSEYDITGESTNTLNYAAVPTLLQLFGDNAANLRHIVAHSKPMHDLLGDSIGTAIENVGGFSIQSGGIPTMGKTAAMTDSSNLIVTDGVSSGVDSYLSLWLAENALRLEQSEEEQVIGRLVDGKENLIFRVQGEFAYTLKVKGYEYSDTGANPNAAALGTAGNWARVASDIKSTAGVRMQSA